ncbi:hypothetical protein N865_19155 [Intrasporangium oryzae NRRL B-24470]|uniref:Uncharacterized protein n=1 Tax=Intrasporangium oryzae NRRL B-24470 TaxID=1386089 RepID=W9GES3_9MICO|nr:hypothetical protein [Intrasporangium oryzae]EWT03333.1 hypothetical protein N865_19155 [Intrasporangium oryzae NRRL B-24470]
MSRDPGGDHRPDLADPAAARALVADDRVLRFTRGLSLFIAPFLIVAFVILYLFPGETRQLWAWTIRPTMTPMVLGAAYAGGAYFFIRALSERRWSALKSGFLAVAMFATLLGIATVLHWDRFNHGHPAFWLWAFLYFTAPFLVVAAWVRNRRYEAPPRPEEDRLGPVARWTVGVVGVGALAQGVVMFVAPAVMIPVWPWLLTPLTCRVMGAIFCLGSAGIWVFLDPRWTTVRLMLQVEVIMISLILVAAARARSELATDRPLTWLVLGGFALVLAGSVALWIAHERNGRMPAR